MYYWRPFATFAQPEEAEALKAFQCGSESRRWYEFADVPSGEAFRSNRNICKFESCRQYESFAGVLQRKRGRA